MVKNFLTFDLENWYDSDFIEKKEGPDFVLEGLNKVLSLLKKYNIKATFFVTGNVLEKYPSEIRKLASLGHEIASHSYDHVLLNRLSQKEIKSNIIRSRKLIKKVTGKYPLGFRAPSWSISKGDKTTHKILEENGFIYSSSVFPINIGVYGSWTFPTDIFNPVQGKEFLEIPVRPIEFLRLRIPFSGGVYFRIIPSVLTYFFIKTINRRKKRAMIYIHPWELCPDIPRVKSSLMGRMISYWNLRKTEKKLIYLMERLKFDSVERILKENI